MNLITYYSTTAHPIIAIFELGLVFDHMMMPWKFRDDISNGSRVIVLTDKQTNNHPDTQTDITENSTTLATLRCASGNTLWKLNVHLYVYLHTYILSIIVFAQQCPTKCKYFWYPVWTSYIIQLLHRPIIRPPGTAWNAYGGGAKYGVRWDI